MTRYFFDLVNGTGLTRDEEGRVIADAAAVRQVAIEEARPIMAHEVMRGCLDLNGKIVVRSENDELVAELPFDEAIDIKPRDRRQS